MLAIATSYIWPPTGDDALALCLTRSLDCCLAALRALFSSARLVSEGDSEGAQPHVDVFQFLCDNGFEQKAAWVEISDNSQTRDDGGTTRPKSGSARKKAKQRANETTVKECYAKTENDADARALVSAVTRGIVGQPNIRAAIWLAIRNPDIVFLGEEVSRLGRILRSIVRAMLWCSGASINRSPS